MKSRFRDKLSNPVEAIGNQQLHQLRQSIRVMGMLVGVLGLAFPGVVLAGSDAPSPPIRIRVNNYSQASPAVLAGAEREAARILGAAGLRTIWLDCPVGHSVATAQDPCQEALETSDIVLRVISESTQNKFQDTVFGFAVHPVLASVYYDYPERLAMRDNSEYELPVILGCVIAHELGHLLLGSNSHSGFGIMQPRWERKQVHQAMTGAMLFTAAQSKHIQAEAHSRMSLQTASLKRTGVQDDEPPMFQSPFDRTRNLWHTHKSKQRRGCPSTTRYFPGKCRSDILSTILMPTNKNLPEPGPPASHPHHRHSRRPRRTKDDP
jgi:hypothetical protein